MAAESRLDRWLLCMHGRDGSAAICVAEKMVAAAHTGDQKSGTPQSSFVPGYQSAGRTLPRRPLISGASRHAARGRLAVAIDRRTEGRFAVLIVLSLRM